MKIFQILKSIYVFAVCLLVICLIGLIACKNVALQNLTTKTLESLPKTPPLSTTITTVVSPSSTTQLSTPGNNPGLPGVTDGLLEKMEIRDLAIKADLIIIGNVEDITYQNDSDGNIITHVIVIITQVLKGGSVDSVTVRVPGGIIDGQSMISEDAPTFRPGERVVLFLIKHDTEYTVLGSFQGKFTIDHDMIGNIPLSQFVEQVKGFVDQQ